jgi:hypothetical protein
MGEVELYLTRSAKATMSRRSPGSNGPGIGQILALVLLYEIQDIARFPRV